MRRFNFTCTMKTQAVDVCVEAWTLKDAYAVLHESMARKYPNQLYSTYLHSFVGYVGRHHP